MELGLREWLIIGGGIVVILIVLDGWRRMRSGGNNLKMKIDTSFSDLPEENFNPELPSGGARVKTSDEVSFGGVASSAVESNAELDLGQARAAGQAARESLTDADPLFTPADNFPPHHDGPSFDELDGDGLSPVRKIVIEPDSVETEQTSDELLDSVGDEPELPHDEVVAESVHEPEAEEEASTSVDDLSEPRRIEPELGDLPVLEPSVDDEPISEEISEEELAAVFGDESDEPAKLTTLDESQVEEPESVTTESPVIEISETEDLLPEDEPETVDLIIPGETESLFSDEDLSAFEEQDVEEDDLIASLPAGFGVKQKPQRQEEEDEADLDLTRPVAELMRPDMAEPEPEQHTMELPEQQEPLFRLTEDESVDSGPEMASFSALDDEPERIEPLLIGDQDSEPDADIVVAKKESAHSGQSERPGVKQSEPAKLPDPDAVLVISVVAPEGSPDFSGRSLLHVILACGMRYGDMKIFHRYEDGIDEGAIQFSMTNALEPGYFDIDTMDTMQTRGVTFFMSMDEPRDVMNAYECMLGTAEAVAKNLHGRLLDENRSTMRSQTKEHYRERIRKFEMRKLKNTTAV